MNYTQIAITVNMTATIRTNIAPSIIFFIVSLGGKLGSFSSNAIISSFNSPALIPRIKSPTVKSVRVLLRRFWLSEDGKYLTKLNEEMSILNCSE